MGHDGEHPSGGAHSPRGSQECISPGTGQESPIFRPAASMPCRGKFPLLSEEAKDLLHADIRSGTKAIYKSRLQAFKLYCEDVGCDPKTCPVEVVTNFLTILRRVLGLKYQTICGYRSAISKFHVGFSDIPLGFSKDIKRVTRACFLEDPPIPRYTDIWDVDILLGHLESMYPHENLTDLELSMKAAALVAINTISRSNTNYSDCFLIKFLLQEQLTESTGLYSGVSWGGDCVTTVGLGKELQTWQHQRRDALSSCTEPSSSLCIYLFE